MYDLIGLYNIKLCQQQLESEHYVSVGYHSTHCASQLLDIGQEKFQLTSSDDDGSDAAPAAADPSVTPAAAQMARKGFPVYVMTQVSTLEHVAMLRMM